MAADGFKVVDGDDMVDADWKRSDIGVDEDVPGGIDVELSRRGPVGEDLISGLMREQPGGKRASVFFDVGGSTRSSDSSDPPPATKRLISKGGRLNTRLKNVPSKYHHFIKDMVTTFIDIPWRYATLVFGSIHLATCLLFSLIWFTIEKVNGFYPDDEEHHHGDLRGGEPYGGRRANETTNGGPCVHGIVSFTSAFLFSMEIHSTVGFGARYVTEKCPIAVIMICVQVMTALFLTAATGGILFAKLSRAKKRAYTVVFSNLAVITQRGGWLYLMLRVGNMRASDLLQPRLKAYFVVPEKVSKEGERLRYYAESLELFSENNPRLIHDAEELFPLTPTTACHKIDEWSPFYEMGPNELKSAQFELVVLFECGVETTGSTVMAKTSYLPNEILWGHRFQNMVHFSNESGLYIIDCASLNSLHPDGITPNLSMKEINIRMHRDRELLHRRRRHHQNMANRHYHEDELYKKTKLMKHASL